MHGSRSPGFTDYAPADFSQAAHAVGGPALRRIARFYDWASWLYPLVDAGCRPGRSRLIAHINRLPAGRLLEVGVGPGRHLRLYREHQVVAIDCSAKMVARCRRHAPAIRTLQMDGEQLSFPAEHFDYVVMCHVLSVTPRPERMLAEVHRVLRSGGHVFVLNHETPSGAWRYIDALLAPFARVLCFRSRFKLTDIAGVERFRRRHLEGIGGLGLMHAYALEK